MNAGRKMKGQRGFTLAETLLAVLILMLVSTIVATGVPAAANAYKKVVITANANTLLSTTIVALRDEMTTAQDVSVLGTSVTYTSASTGAQSKLFLKDDSIMLQEYIDEIPGGTGYIHSANERGLVPQKAATDKLEIKYGSVALKKSDSTLKYFDQIVFSNLEVKCDGDGFTGTLPSLATLTISLIKPTPDA